MIDNIECEEESATITTIEQQAKYSTESLALLLKKSISCFEIDETLTTTKNSYKTAGSRSSSSSDTITDSDIMTSSSTTTSTSGDICGGQINIDEQNNKYRKKECEKYYILQEIVSSEKKYVNDIQEIVQGYHEAILNTHIDNVELLTHIFFNIKEILEFTISFYQSLDSCNYNPKSIALCFINKERSFYKLYSAYCQNYQNAYSALENLEKNRSATKVLQKIKKKYGHNLKLASYLQLPVLHITKYHLLLQRYLKLVDKNEDDDTNNDDIYEIMSKALCIMKNVNDRINNYVTDITSINKMLSTNNIEKLIMTYGRILKEGELYMIESKKDHYVILFEHMLIIRKSISSSKVLYSISSESLAFSPKSYESKNSERVFTIIVYNLSKPDQLSEFTFKTKTIEEKQSWTTCILNSILSGYRNLPDYVRDKVMNQQNTLGHRKDPLTTRAYNYGRKSLFDLRFSLKKAMNGSESLKLSSQRRSTVPVNEVWSNGREYNFEKRRNVGSLPDAGTGMQNSVSMDALSNLNNENNESKLLMRKKNCKSSTVLYEKRKVDSFSSDLEAIYENQVDQNRLSSQSSSHASGYEGSENCSDTSTDCVSINSKVNLFLNDSSMINDNNNANHNDDENAELNKAQNFNDDQMIRSSSSSLNSEGYYSHHDSSLSTLVDENQISKSQISVKSESQSYPKEDHAITSSGKQTMRNTVSVPSTLCHANFDILEPTETESLLDSSFNMKELNYALVTEVFTSRFKRNESDDDDSTVPFVSILAPQIYVSNEIIAASRPKPLGKRSSGLVESLYYPETSNLQFMRQNRQFTSNITINNYNENNCLSNRNYKLARMSCLSGRGRTVHKRIEKLTGSLLDLNKNDKKSDDQTDQDFLLAQAFGLKFLIEADTFFKCRVKELISKFEHPK